MLLNNTLGFDYSMRLNNTLRNDIHVWHNIK